jgi:hypothetical protein
MAEIWPTRLRVSGMGLAYGVGNFGKIISPPGLAVILGANDCIKPAATLITFPLKPRTSDSNMPSAAYSRWSDGM